MQEKKGESRARFPEVTAGARVCHLGKDGQVFACSLAHVLVFLHDKGNLPLKDREHAALGTEMLNKSALAEGRKERELMASPRA